MELLLAIVAIVLVRAYLRGQAGVGNAGSSSTVPGSDTGAYGPVSDITGAWARFEGFFQPGSIAQRDNNPDDVKGDWPGVIGHTSSGIAIFDTTDDGWSAGDGWVQEQEQEHPDWSFSQLFGKVLGDLDGNPVDNDQGNSNNEANFVAAQLGVDPGSAVTDYTGDY